GDGQWRVQVITKRGENFFRRLPALLDRHLPQSAIKAIQLCPGLTKLFPRDVEGLTIVPGEVAKTDRLARESLLKQLPDRHHVAMVHPDPGHVARAVSAAALSDLVFVMRKDEVLAAPMDIKCLAQVGGRHGGALDVPAGPAASPGACPAGLVFCRRLP